MKIRKMQNAGVVETPHVDLPYQTTPIDNLHHYLYTPKIGEIKIAPDGSSAAYLKNQTLNVDINEIPFTTLPTGQYSLRDVQKMAKDDFERGIDGGIAKYDITNPGEINSDENWDYEYWAHRTGLKDNIKKKYINRLIKLHKKDPISAGALLAKYQRDDKVPTNYVLPKTSDGETARQNLINYYSSPQYVLNKTFYDMVNDFAWNSVAVAGMGAANHAFKLYKPLNSLKTSPKPFISPFANPSMVSTIGKDMLLGASLYTAGDIASLAVTGNTMLDNINNTVKHIGGDNKVTDFVTNYVTPFIPIIPVDVATSYISRNLPKWLTPKGLTRTSYDLISQYKHSADKIKRPLQQTDFKSWLRTPEGRHYDWSNYGDTGIGDGIRSYDMDFDKRKYGNIKFIRNLGVVPNIDKDGFVTLAPVNNVLVNFTTDLPFRRHPLYSTIPGAHYMIIEAKELSGYTPLSIEPMDTFFINNLKLKPSQITFLSGDEQSLDIAKNLGFNVESSPEIIKAFKIAQKDVDERNLMKSGINYGGINLVKYLKFGDSGKVSDYIKVIDDYFTSKGRPDIYNYRKMESSTNLSSGVERNVGQAKKIQEIQRLLNEVPYNDLDKFVNIHNGNIWYYPNGSGIHITSKRIKDIYDKVFYDPVTDVESRIMKDIGAGSHPRDIDLYNKIMEYIKQNNIRPLNFGGKIKTNKAE